MLDLESAISCMRALNGDIHKEAKGYGIFPQRMLYTAGAFVPGVRIVFVQAELSAGGLARPGDDFPLCMTDRSEEFFQSLIIQKVVVMKIAIIGAAMLLGMSMLLLYICLCCLYS